MLPCVELIIIVLFAKTNVTVYTSLHAINALLIDHNDT